MEASGQRNTSWKYKHILRRRTALLLCTPALQQESLEPLLLLWPQEDALRSQPWHDPHLQGRCPYQLYGGANG